MSPPKIDNTPGIRWRARKNGWEALWRARTDLVRRGYQPKTARLWCGEGEPTEAECHYIKDQCARLQAEMLVWGRGGIEPATVGFDTTLRGLIESYRTHPLSRYRKLRYGSRQSYDRMLARIDRDHCEVKEGDGYRLLRLEEITAPDVMLWHQKWSADGAHIFMGHQLMTMVRGLFNFGAAALEKEDMASGGHCARLAFKLSKLRIPNGGAREDVLTADMVIAIRERAHAIERPSIALEQAFQFDCSFRQKDCIGEWVPNSEPGISDVVDGNEKWLRGLRWEEIDGDFRFVHVTSKKQKKIVIDLRLADMVMQEFGRCFPAFDGSRASLPARGPVVISEETGIPYSEPQFRVLWREIATDVGIPKEIQNRDTRAGAITEATDAGAPIESVRHAATHSNVSTTQRYSRNGEKKTAEVMITRREYRNKGR